MANDCKYMLSSNHHNNSEIDVRIIASQLTNEQIEN
jgi:hypothetical protein